MSDAAALAMNEPPGYKSEEKDFDAVAPYRAAFQRATVGRMVFDLALDMAEREPDLGGVCADAAYDFVMATCDLASCEAIAAEMLPKPNDGTAS